MIASVDVIVPLFFFQKPGEGSTLLWFRDVSLDARIEDLKDRRPMSPVSVLVRFVPDQL